METAEYKPRMVEIEVARDRILPKIESWCMTLLKSRFELLRDRFTREAAHLDPEARTFLLVCDVLAYKYDVETALRIASAGLREHPAVSEEDRALIIKRSRKWAEALRDVNLEALSKLPTPNKLIPDHLVSR